MASSCPIDSELFASVHREELLNAIRAILLREEKSDAPSLCGDLAHHLPRLVEIACTTSGDVDEAYQFQILEYVCAGCPIQDVSGHCALRRNYCGLFRHAHQVLVTISDIIRRHLPANEVH
jgi:hypothetical protein